MVPSSGTQGTHEPKADDLLDLETGGGEHLNPGPNVVRNVKGNSVVSQLMSDTLERQRGFLLEV